MKLIPKIIDSQNGAFLLQCRRRKRCRFNPWVRKTSRRRALAAHSSILVWEIPWTEEPGRIQSMGSQRVGHN